MNELNERQVSTNLRTVFYGGFVSRAGTRSYVRFVVASRPSALRARRSESRQSALGPIAAVRFNADYDHFYERNQRCFAKSE